MCACAGLGILKGACLTSNPQGHLPSVHSSVVKLAWHMASGGVMMGVAWRGVEPGRVAVLGGGGGPETLLNPRKKQARAFPSCLALPAESHHSNLTDSPQAL